MQESERVGFDNAMNIMAGIFQVSNLLPLVLDQYWAILKPFSNEQFTQACRKLMHNHKRFANDFPLPGDFVAALPVEPERKLDAFELPDVPGQTGRILNRLIALMPPPGHFNTDEEAALMVAKMNIAVDEEKAKDGEGPPVYRCQRCHDEGLLFVYLIVQPGIRFAAKGEVKVERVPNSPTWITRLADPAPVSEDKLTRCMVRCECQAGIRQPSGIPLTGSLYL